MAISLKKCKGLWVTSLQHGSIIGQVTGAVVDKKDNLLVGFKVRPKKSNNVPHELWLPVENIKKIGRDMVLVSAESKLLPEALVGYEVERLVAMPVTTKAGRALGELVDIFIDDKDWQIKSFELEGQQTVVIEGNETVLGKDLVLVQASAEVKAKEKKKKASKLTVEKSGDLAQKTNKMIKKGEKLVERTTNVVRNVLKGSEANLAKARQKIADHDPKRIANLNKKKVSKKSQK